MISQTVIIAILIIFLAALVAFSLFLRINGGFIKKKPKGSGIDLGNAQYIGTREKQDDSFATYVSPYGTLAIVADGIGGFLNGHLASKIAVDTYLSEFKKNDVTGNINYYFQHASKTANYEIRKKFEDIPCGTTVVGTILIKNDLYWVSVGDSIIALFRDGRIIPINRKQNVENWLEDQYFSGKISREDALDHPQSRRLMNYVGYDGFEGAEVSPRPVTLQKGDKVLLYSDGIETLNQIELETLLSRKKASANDLAEDIIDAIKRKNVKSKDNATIIIMSINKI
ncbi:PP2C family protein-serine/threonine phosphatase [Anaeromicropila populeti]|uniref:Serine/threonine protein phosphatase PrpC n=1 Tax=Anaeromicropila populeti TaxID=37658 RepID=A0A1I6L1T9_9FIRM|nr:PP2C family serine/threonine-protein phosphatase [Anaeromicropila populeti]SFR97473.1 Serine/threonine protein phosphatase PrpC [Anaeromicropila populeti]